MKKEKILNKKDRKKAETIALVGTKAGVGVTHTGILLAEFLKEKMGAKTAVVEVNHHGHMEQMEHMIYGYSDSFFSFHGVDYYANIEQERILELSSKSYDYLILDFGIQKKKEEDVIEQCNKKILIGSLNMWEWQEYMQGVKHFERFSVEEEKRYFVSFGNSKAVSRMEKTLQKKIVMLGNQPLGMPLSGQAEKVFHTLV